MINARLRFLLLSANLVALLGISGCALLKPSNEAAASVAPEAAATETLPAGAIQPVSATTAAPAVQVEEVASLDRADLVSPDKIAINIPYADVSVSTVQGIKKRKGRVHIERTAGDASCKLRVALSEELIEIGEPKRPTATALQPATGRAKPLPATGRAQPPLTSPAILKVSAVGKVALKSALPVVANCRFTVELALPESAELSVELKRGSVFIENWDEPAQIKVEWGDVDVGAVGPLTVACGRCTLTGEGVNGTLRYAMESGNVGMEGLSGSVEGQTLGDTVLKWRKLGSGSNVKLVSRAGDVILSFPGGVPIHFDLKAPRGEVSKKDEGAGPGVPVSVTAELGNVKVYRGGK